MVKLTVDVTQKELNAMEDLTLCWNLCKKHKAVINATDDEYWQFTQTCKKCSKINRELRNKTLHLWCKLLTAYLKANKKIKHK